MKIKLFFLAFFVSLISFNGHAQGGPPGCNSMAVVDMDEDGFATFDLNFYRQLILNEASQLNYDLSGYRMDFYKNTDLTAGSLITTVLYTNEVINSQQCGLELVYLGFGPQYDQMRLRYLFSCYILEAAPATGDWDNDGIPNAAEDLNNNQILADDDTDGDGTPNYYDDDDDGDEITTIDEDYNGNGNPADDDTDFSGVPDYLEFNVALTVTSNNNKILSIYPNPVSRMLYFENFESTRISQLSIFDNTGKLVFKVESPGKHVDLADLKQGMYILKMQTDEEIWIKKIVKL